MGKRRIMEDFSIFEISAVDRPAQEGAKAMIMKSRRRPAMPPVTPVFVKAPAARHDANVAEVVAKTEAELVRSRASEIRHIEDVSRTDALRKAHAETYGPPRSQFQQIAASIQHDTGCSRTEALQKAARAHPEALDAFRKGDGRAASGGGGSREAARQKFNLIVEGIRHRKSTTRTAAMSIARREHPTEFEAAYGS